MQTRNVAFVCGVMGEDWIFKLLGLKMWYQNFKSQKYCQILELDQFMSLIDRDLRCSIVF